MDGRRFRIAVALAGVLVLFPACRSGAPERPTANPAPPAPGPKPGIRCTGVAIRPGDDFRGVVASRAAGTTFCVKKGTHRLVAPVIPRDGDRFIGEEGAVINGSRRLTTFASEGGSWVAHGQTQQGYPSGSCEQGYDGCIHPDAVFLDDKPLWRVTRLEQLRHGAFFFDYDQDRIHIAEDPHGHKVETAVSAAAFVGKDADNVVLRNLVVEKFANQAQGGAIGMDGTAERWTVEDNEVRLNHGVGICAGNGSLVRRNFVHHQGQMGLCGHGKGIRVEANEIAFNNTAGFSLIWEAGGSKWARTDGLVVVGNYSHHNKGPGLWTDIDNVNTVYERNRVEHNAGAGIFHEISYDAVIRKNTVKGNGGELAGRRWGAGIQVANSSNVVVESNIVDGNSDGILLINHYREPGPLGPHVLADVTVRGNKIGMSEGLSGVVQYLEDEALFTDGRISFAGNSYRVGDNEFYFAWSHAPRTAAEWQAYGQDADGSFGRLPSKGSETLH